VPPSRATILEALEAGFQEMSTVQVMLHETVAQRVGLNATEHKVMGLLCTRGPITAGALAQATGLTTGAITQIVAKLEEKSHARRDRNPADGRSIYISATHPEQYAKLIGETLEPLREAMARLTKTYSSTELALVLRFLQESLAVTRSTTRAIRDAP
jgi:DNA-binding MarR family transcriptional regulator